MKKTFDRVIASYQRCRSAGPFFDAFYKHLLGKSAEIPPLFARTDFDRQKRMLKQSLFELISFYRDIESSAAEIAKLAERHRTMNVPNDLYRHWLDALVETAAEFDPEFCDDLDRDWRIVMKPGIDAMQSNEPPTSDSPE